MAPRIVVIEDDQHFAEILTDYLGWIGFETTLAMDGEAGVRLLETTIPDVLLTDILLPHMNGIELARRVKDGQFGPPVPVVLMSAVYKDDAAIRRSLRECGADDYLVKPFAMGDLRGVLERVLPADLVGALRTDSGPVASPTSPDDAGADFTRGRIQAGFLAPLLLRVRRERHTGVLRLDAAPRHKSIVFLNGHPVWADGSDEHDRLGTMLLEQGTITRTQFAQAIEAMRSERIDFGSALTTRKILPPSGLYKQLRRLVERRVVSAFGWTDGLWTLSDTYPADSPKFETPLLPAVLKGLEAHGDHEALWAEVADKKDQYVVPTTTFGVEWPALKTGEGIGALGPFLSGRRTLGKLALMEILPKASFRRSIWLMWRAGLISFRPAPMDDEDISPITVSMGLRAIRASRGDDDVSERILADYFRHWGSDHFQLFGVERDADQDEVNDALGGGVLSWTTEELDPSLPGDVRDKAKGLALRVEEARSVLGSPGDRLAYLADLERRDVPSEQDGADIDEAAMFYDNGRGYLRTNDFREAAAEFEKAVQKAPSSAHYLSYCGWAKYRSAQGELDSQAAVGLLERALEIDSRCPTAHYFLGVVHRDARRYPKAARCFEAAVRYDPGFEPARDALRQARELSGRAGDSG